MADYACIAGPDDSGVVLARKITEVSVRENQSGMPIPVVPPLALSRFSSSGLPAPGGVAAQARTVTSPTVAPPALPPSGTHGQPEGAPTSALANAEPPPTESTGVLNAAHRQSLAQKDLHYALEEMTAAVGSVELPNSVTQALAQRSIARARELLTRTIVSMPKEQLSEGHADARDDAPPALSSSALRATAPAKSERAPSRSASAESASRGAAQARRRSRSKASQQSPSRDTSTLQGAATLDASVQSRPSSSAQRARSIGASPERKAARLANISKQALANMLVQQFADVQEQPTPLRWTQGLRTYPVLQGCAHCDGQGEVLVHGNKVYSIIPDVDDVSATFAEPLGRGSATSVSEYSDVQHHPVEAAARPVSPSEDKQPDVNVTVETQTEESALYGMPPPKGVRGLLGALRAAAQQQPQLPLQSSATAPAPAPVPAVPLPLPSQRMPPPPSLVTQSAPLPSIAMAPSQFPAKVEEAFHPPLPEGPQLVLPSLRDAVPLLAVHPAPVLPSLPTQPDKQFRSSNKSTSVASTDYSQAVQPDPRSRAGTIPSTSGASTDSVPQPTRKLFPRGNPAYQWQAFQGIREELSKPFVTAPSAAELRPRAPPPAKHVPVHHVDISPQVSQPAGARKSPAEFHAEGAASMRRDSSTASTASTERVSALQASVSSLAATQHAQPTRYGQIEESAVANTTVPSVPASASSPEAEVPDTFTPVLESIHARIQRLRDKCGGDTEILSVRERILDELYCNKLRKEFARQQRILERRLMERRAAHVAAQVVGARSREADEQLRAARSLAQEVMDSRSRRRSVSSVSSSERPGESVGIAFRRLPRRRESSSSKGASSITSRSSTSRDRVPPAVPPSPEPSQFSGSSHGYNSSPLFQNVSHVLYARREMNNSHRGEASVFAADGPLHGSSNTVQALRASYLKGLSFVAPADEAEEAYRPPVREAASVEEGPLTRQQARLETLRQLVREEPAVMNYVSDRTLAEKEQQIDRLYAAIRGVR